MSRGTRPILPNETIGVGDGYDFQLFDRALLYSADTRFVLAGIVNRMDRAYVCRSELRRDQADLSPDADRRAATGEDAASPRLPMTLNIVLKAKGDHAIDRDGTAITCAEIARRWLAPADCR